MTKFNKTWLMENVMLDEGEGVEVVDDVDMNDPHRWYRVKRKIFRFESKHYGVLWGEAKAEDGKHQYFDLEDKDPPDIEIPEMQLVEVTKFVWREADKGRK